MSNLKSQNHVRHFGNYYAAASVIGVGVIFLLQQFNLLPFGRSWPLYIFIPAVVFLVQGVTAYRNGQLHYALNTLWIGLMIAFMGVGFLVGLSMNSIWPVFAILTGIAMVLRARINRPN